MIKDLMFLMNERIVSCIQNTVLETLFEIGSGAKGLDLSGAAEVLFLFASDKSHIYGLRFFLLLMECMELWSKDIPRKFASKKKSLFVEKYEGLVSCVPKHSGECYLWADLTKIEECDEKFFSCNKDHSLETVRFRVNRVLETLAKNPLQVSDLIQSPIVFNQSNQIRGFVENLKNEVSSRPHQEKNKTIVDITRKNSVNLNQPERTVMNAQNDYFGQQKSLSNQNDFLYHHIANGSNKKNPHGNTQLNQVLNSAYSFNGRHNRDRSSDQNANGSFKMHRPQSVTNLLEISVRNPAMLSTNEYGLKNNTGITNQPISDTPKDYERVRSHSQNKGKLSENRFGSQEKILKSDSLFLKNLENQRLPNEMCLREFKGKDAVSIQNNPELTRDEVKFLQLTENIMSARKLLMHEIFRHIVVLENIHSLKNSLQHELIFNSQSIEQMIDSKSPRIEKERRRVLCELEFIDGVFGIFDDKMSQAEVDFASFSRFRQNIAEIIQRVYGKVPASYQKYLYEKVNVFRTREDYDQFKKQVQNNIRLVNPASLHVQKDNRVSGSRAQVNLAQTLNNNSRPVVSIKDGERLHQNSTKKNDELDKNLPSTRPFEIANKENMKIVDPKNKGNDQSLQAKKFLLLHSQKIDKNNERKQMISEMGLGVPANKMKEDSVTSCPSEKQLSQAREQLRSKCEYAISSGESQTRRIITSQEELKDLIINTKRSRSNSKLNDSAGSIKISFENCLVKPDEKQHQICQHKNSNSKEKFGFGPVIVQSEENFGFSESLSNRRKLEISEHLEFSEPSNQRNKFAHAYKRTVTDLSNTSLAGLASLTKINMATDKDQRENQSFSTRTLLSPNTKNRTSKNQFFSTARLGVSTPRVRNLSAEVIEKKNQELKQKKQELEKALASLQQNHTETGAVNQTTDSVITSNDLRRKKYSLNNVDSKFLIDEYKKKEETYCQLKTKYDKIRQKFVKQCFNEYFFVEKEQSEAMNDITVISQNVDLKHSMPSDSETRSRSAHVPKSLSRFPMTEMCI